MASRLHTRLTIDALTHGPGVRTAGARSRNAATLDSNRLSKSKRTSKATRLWTRSRTLYLSPAIACSVR